MHVLMIPQILPSVKRGGSTMASVEKRGKTWSVRYWVKDALGNNVSQKRKGGFATKSDAMAAAKTLEEATARGVDIHGDQLTCGELMERWFLTKPGTIEKTTLSKYSCYIERMKTRPIYSTRVANLTEDSLLAVVNDLSASTGISIRTAVDYTEPLRFSLKWAARKKLILTNPIEDAPLPKTPKHKQVILSDADINDLVNACKVRNPAFLTPLYLALYGGLCREEVAGLKWDKVISNGVIIQEAITATIDGKLVTKETKTNHRTRTVTLPKFVMDHLRSQEHTSEYVSVSRTGKPYSINAYAPTLARLVAYVNKARQTPMPVPSYHDLRHTHAAMLISMNIQPKVISERLGHASIQITMDTYGYLMPGLQEQVADVLDAKWA